MFCVHKRNVSGGCFIYPHKAYVFIDYVIDKGFFSEAFLFKTRGGRLFSLKYGAGANKHVLPTPDEIYIRSSLHPS